MTAAVVELRPGIRRQLEAGALFCHRGRLVALVRPVATGTGAAAWLVQYRDEPFAGTYAVCRLGELLPLVCHRAPPPTGDAAISPAGAGAVAILPGADRQETST